MAEVFREKEAIVEYTYVFDGGELDPSLNGYGEWGPARLAREARAKASNAATFIGHSPNFTVYRRVRKQMVTDWEPVERPELGDESCFAERRALRTASSDKGEAS